MKLKAKVLREGGKKWYNYFCAKHILKNEHIFFKGEQKMARMKRKNYPLYETTVFRDFRVMMENTAARNPDGVAISYKNAPGDKVVQKITYAQVKRDVRALGEAMMDMGLSGKKVMISGKNSWEWIYCYFALMSIGAVTVPTDKDLPEEDHFDDPAGGGHCRLLLKP